MKPSLCVALLLAALPLSAQEFIVPVPDVIPVEPAPVLPPPTREGGVTVEGIVAEIFNTTRPWQLVNPLAPAEYGNGEKTVSRNPDDPEKPKGFILFALEW